MPPPLSHPSLHLSVLEKDFFVIKKDTLNGDILDALKSAPGFFSVTRTAEEISIVGEAYTDMPQSFQENCTWVCIKIAGPMEHNLTGILASFTAPLRVAQVPVFAVSTWNTDYVLVPKAKVSLAVEALKEDGWIFT